MKRLMKKLFVPFVFFLTLTTVLAACDADNPAAETEYDAVTEDITLSGTDLSGYSLIIPRKASDDESAVMMQLYKMASKSGLKYGNDNFQESDAEILIGATSRAASTEVAKELLALQKENVFHYIISTKSGKLVITADEPLGYTYALAYIEKNFVRNGKLYAPADFHESVSVTMEEYYASEFYAAELNKQKENEERKKAIEKAEEQARLERFEKIKQMNKNFTIDQFGKVISFADSPYAKPELYPEKGQHPRIFFTEKSLDEIRKNLSAEENAYAYSEYVKQSDQIVGYGKLPALSETIKQNSDYRILGSIMAKAFRYALDKDENYGYEAIVSIKNYMLTLSVDESIISGLYHYGYTMHVVGCVYDWCYDLLTPEDKEQLVAGCVSLLAPKLEIGVPPSKQGALVGHGCGGQLLKNWLALSIACYDEYPDMYEYVAGRIFEQYVPGQNYFLQSGAHHQGNAYGMSRFESLISCQLLFNRMSDKNYLVFNDGVRNTVTTFIHYLRPDGQGLRIGDDFNEFARQYAIGQVWELAMYSAFLYDDPIQKGYAKEYTNGFTTGFSTSTYSGISPLMFLILNDPKLEAKPISDMCLVQYNGSPTGAIIARSAWDDPDAAMVYMKVGEAYSANHEHKDAGTFQIFYKGILASDSGSYKLYGVKHDTTYYKQTIAHNSLLIYNPNLQGKTYWEYSGGQSLKNLTAANTLEPYLKSSLASQAKVIGHDYEATNKEYTFSYLAGDLTRAYDAETVDEVSRYMISMMTDNKDCPMVFVTYDRITADDPSYKKTFLLHVQQAPTVTGDGFAVVTNTIRENSGNLVVQSCITDMDYTVIGGEGNEFMVNGVNVPNEDVILQEDHIDEVGWGRIEISPSSAAKTDHMLTAMYVTDAKNTAPLEKAAEIHTDKLVGAVLFNRAALFFKEAGRLADSTSFKSSGTGDIDYYIAGVAAGEWSVSVNGKQLKNVTVAEESGLLRFTAEAGEVSIRPIK